MMHIKDVRLSGLQMKAGPEDGLAEGQFAAYASVFGNKDSYGDIVMPGAFSDTLSEWKSSGNYIPLLWGHDFSLHGDIGYVVDAVEDEKGLLVTAQLDLEDADGQKAYRRIKGRRVNQMSFAYDVIDGGFEKSGDEEFYALRKLKLHEVSVVMVGANQETEILAVKSAQDARALAEGIKAGRTLSAKNESAIREAVGSLNSVLSSLDAQNSAAAPAADNDQEKASGTSEAKSDASDEEPVGAKSTVPDEEPTVDPSVSTLAAKFHIYATAYGRGEGV